MNEIIAVIYYALYNEYENSPKESKILLQFNNMANLFEDTLLIFEQLLKIGLGQIFDPKPTYKNVNKLFQIDVQIVKGLDTCVELRCDRIYKNFIRQLCPDFFVFLNQLKILPQSFLA